MHNATHQQQTPYFNHDCKCCVFLGRFHGYRGLADLYVHTRGETTVLSRWGHDGPEYSSGLGFAYGQISDLTEARARAEGRGLLEYDLSMALHHATQGTPAYDEMRARLPFSMEYQALLARERGDDERAEVLLRHLFALMHKASPDTPVVDLLVRLDARLSKVASVYRENDEAISVPLFVKVSALTDFLWTELGPVANITDEPTPKAG